MFDTVYTEQRELVFGYVVKHVPYDDAADLTSQTFLQAFEAFPRWRDTGAPIGAWLLRIARNLISSYYRRRRDSLSISEYLESDEESPEDYAERRSEYQQLARHLAVLPLLSQQVLACRFVKQMSHDETAEFLNIKSKTSRVIQHRALQVLRERHGTHTV